MRKVHSNGSVANNGGETSIDCIEREVEELVRIEMESEYEDVKELVRPYIDFEPVRDPSLPEKASLVFLGYNVYFLLDLGDRYRSCRNMVITTEMLERWNLAGPEALLSDGIANIKKMNPLRSVSLGERGKVFGHALYLDIDYKSGADFIPYSFGLSFLLIKEYMQELIQEFGHFTIYPVTSQFAILQEKSSNSDVENYLRWYLDKGDPAFTSHPLVY